jgi:hypothetical protein
MNDSEQCLPWLTPQPKQTGDRMNRIYRMDSVESDGGDTFVSIESSTLLHPVHRVHPVEKSGFDLIVANMINPDRYQHTSTIAAAGRPTLSR